MIKYPDDGDDKKDNNSYTILYDLKRPNGEPKTIFKNGSNGISLDEDYYPVPRFRSVQSNYMFIYAANASDHWDCYYLPVEEFNAGLYNWRPLFKAEDMVLNDYGVERDHTYYFKRVNGENIEFCSVDLNNPDFANPKILASGNGPEQINSFKILKDHIYYTVSSNGISESLFEYIDGKEPLKIELPFAAGSISFDYRSPYKNDLWVTLSGWTSNPKEYYLKEDGAFEFTELGMWPDYPEFKNIISEVMEVSSYDGTKVPLSIIRRKDHKFGAGAKGIITAYGAYGMSESPWHHSPIMDFVNKGNIYATAHVRGGGEKGPAWHDAGLKSTKQNSWKDLIACSEYLIDKGYVNSKKLGLNVNSAGAITGGMAINERPELFGAFSAFVPQINVIRIEYLDNYDDSDTAFEFGTVTELESYQDLLKMDPVVNLHGEKKYPSTLLTIGFNDYLIPPSGAGKYIALLQSFNPSNDRPYLLDIKFDAEHEIDWLDDYARMLFFMESELD